MYPEEVITVSKKGKREVRALIDRGKFVRYEYVDTKTEEKSENKIKLVLLNEKGEQEEYFIIPLKQKDRFLLLKSETKAFRKIWDRELKRAVDLF